MHLSHDAVAVLKTLASVYSTSDAEISVRHKFNEKRQHEVIEELRKQKTVTVAKKQDKKIITLNIPLTLPEELSALKQKLLETEEGETKVALPKVNIADDVLDQAATALDAWFSNVQIISYTVLYCPWYDVKLLHKSGKYRTLSINAYTGKITQEL